MVTNDYEYFPRSKTEEAWWADIRRARSLVKPSTYVCYRAAEPIIPDGKLTAPSWKKAPWTGLFGHIEDPNLVPELATNAKMLYDDHYFYVGVDMEAPDIWATITTHDEHVYAYDPDLEVFIDPDCDGERYMEFGINAVNCSYDFLLVKPYARGGPRSIAWNWEGLRSGVQMDGTLNAPWIKSRGWSVVIAFDFNSMQPQAPGANFPPKDGDVWRVNISRLIRDRERTWGRDWTWSCVGVYNMHIPELYGYVQFSDKVVGTARVPFTAPLDWE
jgi:hypothetical protein